MDLLKRNTKRVLIDAAGYALLVAALLTGWLPGPGGVPLAVVGLGLLSIHNAWAKRLRVWVLENGGKLVQVVFPRNPWAEWGYDAIVAALFVVTVVLEARHASVFQMGIGVSAFFLALFIALTNRDRLKRLRRQK